MNLKSLRQGACYTAMALASVATTPAFATADYSAFSFAEVTVTGISGGDPVDLLIEGFTGVFDLDAFAEGDAFAFAEAAGSADSGPVTLGVDDSVEAASEVSGFASDSSFGNFSEAFVLNDLFVDVINFSLTDTFIVDFTLDYALTADASAEFSNEDALAFAVVDLVTSDGLEATFAVDADGIFGPASDFAAGSIDFSVAFLPEEVGGVFVAVDTDGFAVPTPSIMALMGLGLVALGWSRKRV